MERNAVRTGVGKQWNDLIAAQGKFMQADFASNFYLIRFIQLAGKIQLPDPIRRRALRVRHIHPFIHKACGSRLVDIFWSDVTVRAGWGNGIGRRTRRIGRADILHRLVRICIHVLLRFGKILARTQLIKCGRRQYVIKSNGVR